MPLFFLTLSETSKILSKQQFLAFTTFSVSISPSKTHIKKQQQLHGLKAGRSVCLAGNLLRMNFLLFLRYLTKVTIRGKKFNFFSLQIGVGFSSFPKSYSKNQFNFQNLHGIANEHQIRF